MEKWRNEALSVHCNSSRTDTSRNIRGDWNELYPLSTSSQARLFSIFHSYENISIRLHSLVPRICCRMLDLVFTVNARLLFVSTKRWIVGKIKWQRKFNYRALFWAIDTRWFLYGIKIADFARPTFSILLQKSKSLDHSAYPIAFAFKISFIIRDMKRGMTLRCIATNLFQ